MYNRRYRQGRRRRPACFPRPSERPRPEPSSVSGLATRRRSSLRVTPGASAVEATESAAPSRAGRDSGGVDSGVRALRLRPGAGEPKKALLEPRTVRSRSEVDGGGGASG